MSANVNRTQKLDLRLTVEHKRMLAAALADRRRVGLDAERWVAFQDALDAPPRDMPRLKRLLDEPGPFSGSEPG